MAKKKTRAKRATALELLEKDRKKVAEREAKIAFDEAKNDPRLAKVVDLLESKKKQTIEFTKGFGNGPQSFASRIEAHQLWVDEIEAEQRYASTSLELLKEQISYLKTTIGTVASDIAKGAEINVEEEIDSIELNLPSGSDEVVAAEQDMIHAKAIRQEIAKAKKQPKRAKKNKKG